MPKKRRPAQKQSTRSTDTTVRQRPKREKDKLRHPAPRHSPKEKKRNEKRASRHTGSGFLGRSPLGMVIYGPPGVGKSSMAASFPKAGFIVDPQELGINVLAEYYQCKKPVMVEEAGSWTSLQTLLAHVASGKWPIDTLVLDSLTGLEKLCFIHHCEEYFEGNWSSKGFYSYQQGPENAAKTDWPDFIDLLEAVKVQGINVIVLAHSVVKPYKNPDGPDYDQYAPYANKHIWQHLKRWASSILFYNYHVEVDQKGIRNKANTETEERHIYTQWSAAWEAKNAFGLQYLIDELGDSGADAYKALKLAFKKARKS